jgi:hypothetical protein
MALRMLACLGVLFGCATYEPLPIEAPVALDSGHGLLLIVIDSNFEIDAFDIGRLRLGASGSGEQYLLYDLPAGSYNWEQIYPANDWSARMRYVLYRGGDRVRRAFDVHPGIINYPGHIGVHRVSWQWIRFKTVNRSSIAYAGLRELAPDLLEKYQMEYTGFQRDDFLLEYQEKLEQRDSTVAAGGDGS